MSKVDYLVIGLGITGLSCVSFLERMGASCRVWDTRKEPPKLGAFQKQYPHIRVETGALSEAAFEGVDKIVVSPGVSFGLPALQAARDAGKAVWGDIELFAHYVQKPVIAITGSNGKSTVTTLVATLLEAAGFQVAVGGNLGVPALDLLLQENTEVYVLELSSFQLETTYTLKAHAATILNVTADHVDRHGSFEAYAAVKQRVYRQARYAIVNDKDPLSRPTIAAFRGEQIFFGLENPASGAFGFKTVQTQRYVAYGSQALVPCADLFLQGSFQHENSLAAMALASTMGASVEAMVPLVTHFRGLSHRAESIASFEGVHFINDSKGTNVGATLAAIAGCAGTTGGKIVLIAGGDAKGADLSPLVSVVSTLRAAVLLGKDAPVLEALFAPYIPVYRVFSIEEAVRRAKMLAVSQDTVLLSPACSSLDMFLNYAERGQRFKEAVHQLAREKEQEVGS